MPPRPNKIQGPIPVTALKRGDKRVNIPTEELRDFVADAEKAPKTLLYPRDPSSTQRPRRSIGRSTKFVRVLHDAG